MYAIFDCDRIFDKQKGIDTKTVNCQHLVAVANYGVKSTLMSLSSEAVGM